MTDPAKPIAKCFYCDEGNVTTLPATCPKCGAELTKMIDQMTPEEFNAAMVKNAKLLPGPQFYLAS